MKAELSELESQIILTQGHGAPTTPPNTSNGQGKIFFRGILFIDVLNRTLFCILPPFLGYIFYFLLN